MHLLAAESLLGRTVTDAVKQGSGIRNRIDWNEPTQLFPALDLPLLYAVVGGGGGCGGSGTRNPPPPPPPPPPP